MKIIEKPLSCAVEEFFEKANECGMENREGQVEMAKEITEAVESNNSIIVEAGVGIGKSISYLLHIVLNYFRERRQVIIATSTIALQEQLENDLNLLLKNLGVKVNYETARGMTNYICLKRLHYYCRDNTDDSSLLSLADSARKGVQSRKDVKMNNDTWSKICIRSFGEYCRNCVYSNKCEYMQMRKRILVKNQIIICNHNMLVTHLINIRREKGIFSDSVSTIVVDEAHNLESKFRDAFTATFNKNQIIRELLYVRDSRIGDIKRLVSSVVDMIEALFRYLDYDFRLQKAANTDSDVYYYRPDKNIKALILNIRKAAALIESKVSYKLRCLRFFRDMDNGNNLVWLSCKNGIRINVCKKDISEDIKKLLFVNNRRTILTSATLSTGNKANANEQYGFFLNSIGNPLDIIISRPKESPFDYVHNSMLYISDKLPYPNKNNRRVYQDTAISEIVELLKITYGKALILFTSKEDMNAVFKKLSNMGMPFKIMIQSSDSSQEHRINSFKTDINSVMLGTGVYWEGINIVGESLSQIIIYKLPFAAPDPIIEYKMSKSADPLMNVIVPEMIIKLRQGVGRLIRCHNDKGIISILDPRLSSKSNRKYKTQVLDSLPQKSHTENLDTLSDFWRQINERIA